MRAQHILFMPDDRKAQFHMFQEHIKCGHKHDVQVVPNAIIKAIDKNNTCGVFDAGLNPVKSAEIRWTGGVCDAFGIVCGRWCDGDCDEQDKVRYGTNSDSNK